MLKEKCKDCILFIEKEREFDTKLEEMFCNVIGDKVEREYFNVDCMCGMEKKYEEEL